MTRGDRAIVFDLDGTLVEFEGSFEDILRDAFGAVDAGATDAVIEQYAEALGQSFGALEPDPVGAALDSVSVGVDPDAFRAALARCEAEQSRPTPGAHDDLARLSETYPLGVLTNGLPDTQRRKLASVGLDEYVDAVLASYEVGAHKPALAPYRELEARLDADTYAMVGDTQADVEGARNAGWAAHRYEGGGFGDVPDVFGWDDTA